jgi:hypothetical protein
MESEWGWQAERAEQVFVSECEEDCRKQVISCLNYWEGICMKVVACSCKLHLQPFLTTHSLLHMS